MSRRDGKALRVQNVDHAGFIELAQIAQEVIAGNRAVFRPDNRLPLDADRPGDLDLRQTATLANFPEHVVFVVLSVHNRKVTLNVASVNTKRHINID